MKKVALIGLVGAALALGVSASVAQEEVVAEERDARIIVELKATTKNKTYNEVVSTQNEVLAEISQYVTTNYTVSNRYTNALNGLVLEVPASAVSTIRELPGVNSVEYDQIRAYKENDGVSYEIKAVKAPDSNISSDTMNKPDDSEEGKGTFIAILDSAFMLDHEDFVNLSDSDVKYTKTEIEQNIADAGNKFHADKTTSTWYNNKIPFYYDYGGETNVPNSLGTPDHDVYSGYDGAEHGQHVSTSSAGNGPYEGVAPKAQLALMKVFTIYEPTAEDAKKGYTSSLGAYDTAILNGLEDAALLGCDLASMSLGSDLDDFDSETLVQRTLRTLAEEGLYVNVAAGNSGKGMWESTSYKGWTPDMVETGIMSGYANNSGSFTVAAAQPLKQYYETALMVNGRNIAYEDQVTNYTSTDGEVVYEPERYLSDLLSLPGHSGNDFEWVRIPGWGEQKDYDSVKAAAGGTNVVQGRIAVVSRGTTTFTDKCTLAYLNGAVGVIIIDNDPSATDFNFRFDFAGYMPKTPVVIVLNKDYQYFESTEGTVETCTIVQDEICDNPTARQVTTFTTDGATYDLRLKPEIAAPGENIYGAVFKNENGQKVKNAYDYFSGTSMATPNVTGSMAVILSERSNLTGQAYQDYKDSLQCRIMSTADPMKDAYGTEFSSPRIQGAGLVDINGALKSKVYLEGIDEEGNGIGRAKIELKNNADIAQGKLKLKFNAFSEEETAVRYTAKTYLYKPSQFTLSDSTMDEDKNNYPEFTDVKFMSSTYNELITTLTQTVELQPGKNVVTLNEYNLTNEQKQALEFFENGCILEGYVVLTPEDTQKETVNIPFMGFYGDYLAQSPVEPFSFEKEEGKTYQSDLVNYLCANSNLGLTNADFGSMWAAGYWKNWEDVSMASIMDNSASLRTLVDGNGVKLKMAGENPYNGNIDPSHITFGNNGFTNTMIIQQFVTRSCIRSDIELKNLASQEVVLNDHMFDSLYGSSGKDGSPENLNLYKSMITNDLVSGNVMAHRAYTIIPLYDQDTNTLYPEGEYEMKFSYQLAAGGNPITMTYRFTINSETPAVSRIEKITKNGTEYARFIYEGTDMSYVNISNKKTLLTWDADNEYYYADVKVSDYKSKNYKVNVISYNGAFGKSAFTTYLNDEYNFVLSNANLVNAHDYTVEYTQGASGEWTVKVVLKKSNKEVTTPLAGGYDITFDVSKLLDVSKDITFIDNKTKNQPGTEAGEFTLNGNMITLHSKVAVFQLKGTALQTSNPEPEKKGCGGNVVSTTSLVVFAAALLGGAIILTSLLRRKED